MSCNLSIIYLGNSFAMVMTPTPPNQDLGFFLRPFSDFSWVCLLSIVIFSIILILITLFIFKLDDNSISVKMISFTIWIMFTMIYAYYGGALTMFFITEDEVIFNNIKDVLKIFPEWNIIFDSGDHSFFSLPAQRVKCHSYQLFVCLHI